MSHECSQTSGPRVRGRIPQTAGNICDKIYAGDICGYQYMRCAVIKAAVFTMAGKECLIGSSKSRKMFSSSDKSAIHAMSKE